MLPDRVTVVVPTYNERENLPRIAPAVLDQGYRLLIVDDGSPDRTGELADFLSDGEERMSVVHRSHKQGLGPAYAHGFAVAIEAGAKTINIPDTTGYTLPIEFSKIIKTLKNRVKNITSLYANLNIRIGSI